MGVCDNPADCWPPSRIAAYHLRAGLGQDGRAEDQPQCDDAPYLVRLDADALLHLESAPRLVSLLESSLRTHTGRRSRPGRRPRANLLMRIHE